MAGRPALRVTARTMSIAVPLKIGGASDPTLAGSATVEHPDAHRYITSHDPRWRRRPAVLSALDVLRQ